jgi:predicted nucleic acid-binding Zn ribbon protein
MPPRNAIFACLNLRCKPAKRGPLVCGRIRAPMDKAGDFLGRVVRRFDRPEATLAWLAAAWPAIAGETLAAHTRPVRCDNTFLEVAADAHAWQRQIEGMKRELRDRINRAWGANLVREVAFVAEKPGPRFISREADNAHIPFIRRRRA